MDKQRTTLKTRYKEIQLSSRQIANISEKLYHQFRKEERKKKYAPVKEVLALLGKGLLLTTLFMAPNAGKAIKPLLKKEKDWDAWKKYNPAYLKRAVKSLEKKKQIIVDHEKQVVQLTQRGKQRILQFALAELKIEKPRFWDGKWRIVLYDIPSKYRGDQTHFQRMLKRLGFYQLQKSVYLHPYDCKDVIEYIRSFYGLREFVMFLVIDRLENDQAYRIYFNLN